MDRDRYRRLQSIFEAILAADPAERPGLLDSLCAGDGSLRRAVESLVAADSAAETGSLEASIACAARELEQATLRRAGREVGRFRIVAAIAAGGMGAVYEAEQSAPRRRVAIKMLNARAIGRTALARFRAEAEMLARLSHPGIAQIYEAGLHDEGFGAEPYFAMEFVPNARPITEAVRELAIPREDRLRLFAEVCDAVHYGHQRGIIHRDLKPANILVDGQALPPRAKIIDFGVARAVDGDLASTVVRTEVGTIVGTLPYMSPEQFDADPHAVDLRADVYALGVLLFELLTDSRPFELTGLSLQQAARIVADRAPQRPGALVSALRGDLETIILKALEKDPDRRFNSATELAADVRRFLASEPIAARPPTAGYQLRLFARRNRGLVAGMVAALAMLVAAIVGTSIGLAQAARSARDRAVALGEAEYEQYVADLIAAEAALRSGDQRLALERLEAAPERLRGFEWSLLRSLADESLRRVATSASRMREVAFDASGERMATLDVAGEVRVVETATGQPIASWRVQPIGHTYDLEFSPDGRRVAAGYRGVGVVVWDIAERREIARFATPLVITFAWSPEGERIAALEYSLRRTIWRVADGALLAEGAAPWTEGDRREGQLLWFAQAGSEGTGDGSQELIEVRGHRLYALDPISLADRASDLERKEDRERTLVSNFATRAALDRRGRRLALVDPLGTIQLIDLSTGERVTGRTDADGGPIRDIGFLDAIGRLCVARREGMVEYFALDDLRPLGRVACHSAGLHSLTVLPDGRHFATASADGSVKLWDGRGSAHRLIATNRAWVYDLAFSPDGTTLWTAAGEAPPGDPPVQAWRLADEGRLWASEGPTGLHFRLGLDSAGERIVVGGGISQSLELVDQRSGRTVGGLTLPAEMAPHLVRGVFRPGHDQLAAIARAAVPVLFDCSSGAVLRSFEVPVSDGCFDPAGRHLVVGRSDAPEVVVFDADSGAMVRRIGGFAEPIEAVAISPDGSTIATCDRAGNFRVVRLADGEPIAAWSDPSRRGLFLQFDPSGRRILAGIDHRLRIWDAFAGRELVTLKLAADTGACRVAFRPDGRAMAIGLIDGRVELFAW